MLSRHSLHSVRLIVRQRSRDLSTILIVRFPNRLSLRRIAAVVLSWALSTVVLAAAPATAAAVGPAITSIVPSHGSVVGGEQVTINGSGFTGALNACASKYDIWFGTDLAYGYAINPSSYTVVSDSQINAVVPPNFGGTVDVRVHNLCGTSPVQGGDTFTYDYPPDECTAGSCSLSIGSSEISPVGRVALGFLDGFNTDAGVTITPQDAQLVQALGPRQWRFGQSGLNEPGGGVFGLARSAGALISLDLTSDWENWAHAGDPNNATTPYNDLSTYSSFIYSDVENRIAAGDVPDYFDVWNEPADSGTVNQWLSVFGTAYQAIKAADPTAKVVGPSDAWPLLQSGGHPDTAFYDLSLTDFLDWEMSTGYRFAAISYHEDGTTVTAAPNSSPGVGLPAEPVPGGFRDYWSPAAIGNHVTLVKQLLASYPALAETQVFVNEYGPPYAENIPGWMVGDIASLEQAGADEAMLTCVATCDNYMDGLIGADSEPQMPYWVMQSYSGMSGERVDTSSSAPNLYALATHNDSSETVEALIGRADGCWGGQCPEFQPSSAPQVQVSVTVSIPWNLSAVDVTVYPFANSATNPIGYNDVATEPTPTTTADLPVQNGAVSVPINAVGDGDAFYVTVVPHS